MRRILFLAAAAALSPAVASAQASSLFGSSGIGAAGTGTSSFGSTGGTMSATGGSSTGMSSFGGAAGGTSAFGGTTGSAFGASGVGGTAGGAGATGAAGLTSQVNGFGTLGQSVGTTGFVGRAGATAGQVGNRTAGQQTGMTGNLGQSLNRLGNNRGDQGNANGSRSAPKLVVRPVQRIGFDFAAPSPTVTRAAVSTRLAELSTRRPELNGITVSVDDQGRHVLTGTVPSESARGMAAALARLEPGVREVVNELSVDQLASP